MIKVLINGTPIYKLCFARRKYSQIKRKHVNIGRIAKAIEDAFDVPHAVHITARNVIDAVKAVHEARPLYETTALVYIIDAKKGEPPVATATVRQNPVDTHSPEEGRRKSLDKLLRTGEEIPGIHTKPPFSRIERTAIRKAYDNRPRIKSTPPPVPAAPAGSIPQLKRAEHAVVSKIISFPLRESRIVA